MTAVEAIEPVLFVDGIVYNEGPRWRIGARQRVLLHQAEGIQRASLRTVADPADRDDVTDRYDAVLGRPSCSDTGVCSSRDRGRSEDGR
jgi:hypothetical protein